MASLILGTLGSAVGGSLFGGSVLGGLMTGAQLGGMIGGLAGSLIDDALMPARVVRREGPRLGDVQISGAAEGAPIPAVFGRARLAGQLIWATRFRETVTTTRARGGGKGLGAPKTAVETTEYSYAVSLAFGLCEGEIARVGRIWADGQPLDPGSVAMRVHRGAEDQLPDALIAEIEGAENAPAYRGLAYVVLEWLELAPFGNRIPQLAFEIVRPLTEADPDALENRMQAVCLIPSAGEAVYATEPVLREDGRGGSRAENVNTAQGGADIAASLDQLEELAPQMGAAALTVSWFATDLRAGHCLIKPGVETPQKTTTPAEWRVNGVARADAHLVSQHEGRPAFGGTPSDRAVVQAIAALKAKGWRVLFYPFLLVDVPPGNALPDPHGGAEQPAYPWRGRIACHPAPGAPGSPDGTAAAAAQVDALFGAAAAAQFAVDGTEVSWTGGAEWSLRRMVLHYAHLCAAAGGVDAFCIGTEMVGLNAVRSAPGVYPAVARWKELAADVRAILGPGAVLTYAADWSEWNGHAPAPGEWRFHLDPLWSDPNVGAVAIDNYLPLADWRDGGVHADAAPGRAVHDRAYLKGNIEGGEYFDFAYADDAARTAQTRTPIADPLGKPWVFRRKDIHAWWSNPHRDRVGGAELPAPTAWTPQSKPVWLTELGCPAVDKGANRPNVFLDPKSSESALPFFSRGVRDDLIQRRFLEAHLSHWRDPANNPVSSVYGAPMLDVANIYLWAWDARPYPDFPARSDVWADAPNWRRGHWLNGRVGQVPLGALVTALCARAGFADVDASALGGLVTGFVVDRVMSVRDALEPLALAYHFDLVESDGAIRAAPKDAGPVAEIAADALAVPHGAEGIGLALTRGQESDVPQASKLTYADGLADYRQAVAEARRPGASGARVAQSALPLVLDADEAAGIAARLLQDAAIARDAAAFALPPSRLALDPGDAVTLLHAGRSDVYRLREIADGELRRIEAVRSEAAVFGPVEAAPRAAPPPPVAVYGRPVFAFLDLPLLREGDDPQSPWIAARADPWPGAVALYKAPQDDGYALAAAASVPATMGVLRFPLHAGPVSRWDLGNSVYVELFAGALESRPDLDVFAGANLLAVENADGAWELLQFADAVLEAPGQWRLTRLLRGQLGTEDAMRDPVAAGARVVLIDGALVQAPLAAAERLLPIFWRYGPAGAALPDAAFTTVQRSFAGQGLRPYAPCHARGVWQANGDVMLSWTRRGRLAADSWEQEDVPLGEESERYDLEILQGGAVLRAASGLAAPAFLYAAAQQTADFGAPQSALTLRVRQRSAIFGPGAALTATVFA